MSDFVTHEGDMPPPPPRDYDLDIVVELRKENGLLLSLNDEKTACAVIAQCILGTIQGQPPMAQERLIHMLDRKQFTITFQIVKANERSSSNVH